MIRIVFSDFDGTVLLRMPDDFSHAYITEDSFKGINDFIDKGGRFVVTSGRFSQSVHEDMHNFGLQGTMIGANGSVIIREDGTKEVFRMAPEVPERILEEVLKINKNIFFVHFSDDEIISRIENTDGHLELDSEEVQKLREGVHRGRFTTNKIAVRTADEKEIQDIRRMLAEKFAGEITISDPNKYQVDLTAYGVNKGSAIRKLLQEYGFNSDEAAGFGDALNDMAIMENVSLKFAMAHGSQQLKDRCDYVVETVGKAFEIIDRINREAK